MRRTMIVAGARAAGAGAVMAQQELPVQQDNLMRSIAKNQYGVIQKMTKGDIPFDKKAVDQAIASIEADVGKIAKTFEVNPKQDVVNADLWLRRQRSGRTRPISTPKIPPVQKAIADVKGKITDVASLEGGLHQRSMTAATIATTPIASS